MNKSYALIVLVLVAVMLVSYNFTAYAEHTTKKGAKNDLQKTKSLKKSTNVKDKTSNKGKHIALDYTKSNPSANTQLQKIDKSGFKRAPKLAGITGYINTGPDELKVTMKDKVVLYDFWTYSCYNCQNTFPYLKSWHEKYSDKGLVIVGIHYPEFQFERDINNVRQAVANNDIKFPVVLDNDGVNWDAFGNRYWPRFYLADAEGYIRYDHIGEGAYDETENMIKLLLKENTS
jgi:thiol-disulfide isomerase/thioredoxin